jgi:hypothetical protein
MAHYLNELEEAYANGWLDQRAGFKRKDNRYGSVADLTEDNYDGSFVKEWDNGWLDAVESESKRITWDSFGK